MKKILVIEDEEIIRENILKLLKAEGFDVTGAENGERRGHSKCDRYFARIEKFGSFYIY